MKIHRFDYRPAELLPYIDWGYFFHAWGIRPQQQNTGEAQSLKNDAVAFLTENDCSVHALFRLCCAQSAGDNLLLDGRVLPLLRQQHSRTDIPNLCLSDFVSPVSDSVGLFATSVTENVGTEIDDDPYRKMLSQTLADRLSEAAASCLHRHVRTEKELWGYSPDENFSPQELNSEPYAGIRPAIGYPSLPDQSVIFIIDELLDLGSIGIGLTPNGAMSPHASVCGLMFAHPASRYFSVGKISDGQLTDYAMRRGIACDVVKKFLAKNL